MQHLGYNNQYKKHDDDAAELRFELSEIYRSSCSVFLLLFILPQRFIGIR
jgi:hypothetical protein